MFQRILIPTDFSTASEWVFDDAVRIAGSYGAEIVILHIRMTWESHPAELRFPADSSLYEYAEKQELERLRERIRRANASIHTRLVVRTGPDPGTEICGAAIDEKAGLLVMATHARHHVAHLLIGSTTLSVIRNPPAPALAIRYGIRKRARFQHLIVPVHLKQTSTAALQLAHRIAEREGSSIELITVCEERDRQAAGSLLERLSAGFGSLKVQRQILAGGDIEREIVRYTARAGGDVIFLNAGAEMSDIKTNIVRHAPTPVMVVPPS